MNKPLQTAKYIVWDFLSALVAWTLFFAFRKFSLEGLDFDSGLLLHDTKFWIDIFVLPASWCLFYWFQGYYKNVYRKSRLKELQMTLWATVIGVTVIFFALILDDQLTSYRYYYSSFIALFTLHFVLTYAGRVVITSRTANLVHQRRIGFPTLLVGSKEKAYNTYLDLDSQAVYSGNKFEGFITVNGHTDERLPKVMPCLGSAAEINSIVERFKIEEVIFAIEDNESDRIKDVIRILDRRDDVILKITPDLRDIVYGSVKNNAIFHSPLITINPRPMPEWEYSLKRLMDILLSLLALVVLLPVFLVTALIVKCTSPGPVFYAQERIGYRGKPFKMHKFRSMYVDAEAAGPALSTGDDPRITPFGRIMRKYRLDEIPQFYNVLKGTMSIVGPRPERQYFIDQIVERAPEYLLLQKVKPGITSWGQVKFGYAENVDEMVERLRYDLLYLENMSIATDIKILLYTFIIILQGRGK